MLFTPSNWENTFIENQTTSWKCPTCFQGYLESKKELLTSFETSKSKIMQNEIGLPPEEMIIRFSGFLTCNNTKCKDKVAVVGRKNIETKVGYKIDGAPYEDYSSVYVPQYFQPEILFFQISENCPKKISLQIKKSFSNYWNDISSSANKIRKALELIMDERNVKKEKLHHRIKEFEKKEPEISKSLMALKWIGNIGSHTGLIDKDDILKTFQVLHFSLTKLYDNREQNIQTFIEQINKNKGL